MFQADWLKSFSVASVALPSRKVSFNAALQVALGSIFLALMAQIAIPLPFSPVPITLQSLGVALLAISLGRVKAPLAVCGYLAQASIGLPVLAGGLVNPLWMIGPKAGYLLGFVLSSWIISRLLELDKTPSLDKPLWIKRFIYIACGETSILCLGTLWLACFVGLPNALLMGFLPFLPGALAKITVATTAIQPIRWIRQKM
jgi:biotin transport system substrate-specific component